MNIAPWSPRSWPSTRRRVRPRSIWWRNSSAYYGASAVYAWLRLPPTGALLITIGDSDKAEAVPWLKLLGEEGYRLCGTGGTADLMRRLGLEVGGVAKVGEPEPNSYSIVADGTVDGVVNTVAEVAVAMRDGFEIRRAATERGIPCYTSMDTARAAIEAVVYGKGEYSVAPTVDYVRGNGKARSGD